MVGKTVVWLVISVISALLYWLGGRSWGNKAIRRFGCPLVVYGYLWWLKSFSGLKSAILLVCAYILTALALSTYHDYLAPDKTSENWLCWLMTGLCYGLAAFPLIWTGIHWYLILIRAIILAITIMWLRERTGKDWLEEMGSGFLLCVTIPILLI